MQKVKNIFHLLQALAANFFYGAPAGKMTVIGITGTDGKTSTTHLVYHILKTAGFKVSFISTVEANIMGHSIDTGFHVTTPSPFQLQKLIKLALKKGTTHLILEITSHALDQFRHFGSSVDIAVITNISHEHLDYHGSMSEYRKAKSKILKGAKYAVLNKDDDSFNFLKSRAKGKLVYFSLKGKTGVNGIKYQGNPYLLGDYSQYNILAASTVADILKIDQNTVKKAVKTFPGIPGRLERIKNKKNLKLYIDFAHKINALDNVLKTLKKETGNKLIAVFGSAGLRDRTKRPIMGKVAAKSADFIVLTAEDPRTEDVRDIINSIAQGCLEEKMDLKDKFADIKKLRLKGKYFFKIPDRQEAINFAVKKLARAGDTLVFCGKGHEKSMCYGTTEYPWDEKKAIKKALYG